MKCVLISYQAKVVSLTDQFYFVESSLFIIFFVILFSEFQLNLFVIVRCYMIIFRVNKIRLLASLGNNQNLGSILEIITNGLSPQFTVSRTSLIPGLFAL